MRRGNLPHPRNKYRLQKPNFQKLAEVDEDFKKHLSFDERGRPHLAWKNPYALRQLTKTLLQQDFNLEWDMPIDRLCPTAVGRMVHVPCAVAFCNLFRLNYLHWIEDLLAERRMETAGTWRHPWIPPGVPSKVEYHGSTLHLDLPNHVRGAFGIDIGTGASAIYPLLGAAMNDWHFLATEIDPVSISSAANNIKRNGLQDRIQICEVQSGQFIEPALANASFGRKGFEKEADSVQHVQCDFLMCNPPYFSTMQEARSNPRASCMGQPWEMATAEHEKGGEEAFITALFEDSKRFKHSVCWFTSLIGRKSTLPRLLKRFKSEGVEVLRTTSLTQGTQLRWAIAWSFFPPSQFLHSTPDSNTLRLQRHVRLGFRTFPAAEEMNALKMCRRIVLALLAVGGRFPLHVFGQDESTQPQALESSADSASSEHAGKRQKPNPSPSQRFLFTDEDGNEWVEGGSLPPAFWHHPDIQTILATVEADFLQHTGGARTLKPKETVAIEGTLTLPANIAKPVRGLYEAYEDAVHGRNTETAETKVEDEDSVDFIVLIGHLPAVQQASGSAEKSKEGTVKSSTLKRNASSGSQRGQPRGLGHSLTQETRATPDSGTATAKDGDLGFGIGILHASEPVRKMFWKVVDILTRDINREGRKWRRLRQMMQQKDMAPIEL